MQAYSSSKKKLLMNPCGENETRTACYGNKRIFTMYNVHRTYQFQFKKTTHMCMYIRNGNGVWCMGQAKGNKKDEKTRIHKNWYFNVDKVKNMPIEHCMITLLTATVATVQHHTITIRVTATEKKQLHHFSLVQCSDGKICIWYGNSRGKAQNKYRFAEILHCKHSIRQLMLLNVWQSRICWCCLFCFCVFFFFAFVIIIIHAYSFFYCSLSNFWLLYTIHVKLSCLSIEVRGTSALKENIFMHMLWYITNV